ncbi:MAG TPA: beta-galactosidase trimerization domain-containing protein [Bryobacteraceae bacterium]|nr:beta-galactosidase trimerization domain-containing protein [Bryobacteraceae bacterium]
MRRREFLELLPSGMVALNSGLAAPQREDALPRAHWMDDGIIDAGGTHEPYLFAVRRGGQSLDAREQYEKAQSEDVIRSLKNAGVEVFHTHLYKGFGMAAEMPEMQDTVRAAVFAHSLGMKIDTYIQWNTLMYETFFAEEPRAKDWVQRDSLGRPILLTYGFQQSYRYRPCFKNQEYLDYLKKIVRFAVQEVKTDFIHFDNFDLNAEPDSCHCRWCVNGFRDRLRTKYTAPQRQERFGFSNIDYVNPPDWNASNPPEKLRIISDPAIQEWIDFRCQLMADALHQMAAYAKSLNPEVVIEVNPHGITGGNRAWAAGLDHARFLPFTQAFWTEEPNVPGLEDDGRLVSKIRSYKLARTFNNVLFTYTDKDELALAECLAFNQTIGFGGVYPLTPASRKYIAFYRTNRQLFHQTRDLADVAVLRSYASIAYNQPRCQLSAILSEQALIEAAVPFHLIFDQHLNNLAPYRVVVLPDSECLSDSQIQNIRDFVAAGGGLVVIGASGLYDQWRRERVTPGLAGLVDAQPQRHSPTEQEQRKEVGRGRVFFLPSLRFDGALPEFHAYFTVDNRFWKNPANAAQFLEGMAWARNGAPSVQVEGQPHLVANAVEQQLGNPSGARLHAIHLVNYQAHRGPLHNIRLTCRCANSSRVSSVHLYSPDFAGKQELSASSRDAAVTFTVPQVDTYAIATAEWI